MRLTQYLVAPNMSPRSDDPETARITSRQLQILARTPRSVCHDMGLSWTEAQLLYGEEFISFDPDQTRQLDESQEAELTFLGALLAAGCPRSVVRTLVRELRPPYAYDVRRLYYDWGNRRWRLLPGEDEPEQNFFQLIERLHSRGDHRTLTEIRDWLEAAIDIAVDGTGRFTHEPPREAALLRGLT